MASALDAVLGLIAQEKQQEQFKSQQITEAVNIFQRAREATQANQIQKLQLAQDQPVKDAQVANYLSEAESRKGQEMINNLLKGSQLKQAGRETRDKSLLDAGNIMVKNAFGLPASVNQYLGEAGNMMPPTSITPENKSNLSTEQRSLAVDEFGDKTADALEAQKELELQMVKDKKKAEQEARTPQEKEKARLDIIKTRQDVIDSTPAGKAKKAVDDLENKKKDLELKATVPTAQQRNDLTATENQLDNIKKLHTLADKIPAGRISGSISGLLSSVTGGEWDEDTRQYLKQRPAYAVTIYRALTGDTRLSDADAKGRALPLLWHPTESAKIRKSSFDTIEKALEARKKLISEGKYTQDKDGQFITPLEDVLAEAESAGKPEFDGVQKFNVGGKVYNIPADKVEAFKKAKGIK